MGNKGSIFSVLLTEIYFELNLIYMYFVKLRPWRVPFWRFINDTFYWLLIRENTMLFTLLKPSKHSGRSGGGGKRRPWYFSQKESRRQEISSTNTKCISPWTHPYIPVCGPLSKVSQCQMHFFGSSLYVFSQRLLDPPLTCDTLCCSYIWPFSCVYIFANLRFWDFLCGLELVNYQFGWW